MGLWQAERVLSNVAQAGNASSYVRGVPQLCQQSTRMLADLTLCVLGGNDYDTLHLCKNIKSQLLSFAVAQFDTALNTCTPAKREKRHRQKQCARVQ